MSGDFLDDRALLSLVKTALQLPRKGKRVVDPDSSETESDSDSDKVDSSDGPCCLPGELLIVFNMFLVLITKQAQ